MKFFSSFKFYLFKYINLIANFFMVKNVYAEEEVLTRIANALFDLAVSLAEKKKYQEKKLA
ncbi:MAG: hypothetical protein LBF22_03825 [Deltaproteobacteria bacterium]|nr:hypothetical protein [Deltaproteobacteria bacterium]